MNCKLCMKPVLAKGWCSMHYNRWRRHGDPRIVHNMGSGPRKAQLNDVIIFFPDNSLYPVFGVVVDYRTKVKWGRYRVIRTDSQGRYPRGEAIWVDSTNLESQGRQSKRPGIVYRANQRLGDRGCACQCCLHVKGFESGVGRHGSDDFVPGSTGWTIRGDGKSETDG